MKKASGVLEMALLLCFIACISVALLNVFNNQKRQLTNMSTVVCRDPSMCKDIEK